MRSLLRASKDELGDEGKKGIVVVWDVSYDWLAGELFLEFTSLRRGLRKLQVTLGVHFPRTYLSRSVLHLFKSPLWPHRRCSRMERVRRPLSGA